jgi:hypothetical protein
MKGRAAETERHTVNILGSPTLSENRIAIQAWQQPAVLDGRVVVSGPTRPGSRNW